MKPLKQAITLLGILLTTTTQAQSNWQADSASANAYIISDNQALYITGTVNDLMWIRFRREATIVYRNEQGITDHGTFSLPESWDPTYDNAQLPLSKRGEEHRPFLTDLKVKSFEATLHTADGKTKVPHIKNTESLAEEVFMQRAYPKHSSKYEVEGLSPGDTLKVSYVWDIPYNENWFRFNAKRIFFHTDIPREKFNLLITHPRRLQNEFGNTLPDSTVLKDKKIVYHYWSAEKLTGCINEIGARPYEELPHIVMQLNTANLIYNYSDPVTGMYMRAPYWRYVLKYREERALWLKRVARRRFFGDRQNKKVDAFLKTATRGIPENNSMEKVVAVHHAIATDFDWQEDDNWYAHKDKGLERMGDYTEDKIIREISRYNLYCKYISRLGMEYKTAYMLDKRVGRMGENYMSPLWNTDFTFVMNSGNDVYFLFPKKSRFGYETNELPFYWEATSAVLTDPYDLWMGNRALPDFIATPASDELANLRVTSTLVQAELKAYRLYFDTRLSLSGQFSTLTRGNYLYGTQDSTINPMYFQRIDQLPSRSATNPELTSFSEAFPFKANFRLKYTKGTLKPTEENAFSIPLKNWFNTVREDAIDPANRSMDFYNDFRFLDKFTYQIRFDQNVVLDEQTFSPIEIRNEYGFVKFEIKQTSDYEVWISLDFSITTEKVPAERLYELKRLYETLVQIDGIVLKGTLSE